MVMNRRGSSRTAGNGGNSNGTKKRVKKLPKWVVIIAWLAALGVLAFGALIGAVLVYYDHQLPDLRQLSEYKPPLITRVYDRNGEIVAEYANERRIWVPYNEIPKPVVQAYLAAEDTHFFEHSGYDLKAILRAMLVNVMTDRKQGASTITQQVAKTYLLSSERTYTRKIKELILSWRIEKAYTKSEILELYLNRIYLGNGSYGVAAAAQTYFSKSLSELTLPERAMIAGMPQAPTRYNPVRNPSAAKARRDIILVRLREEGFITPEETEAARATPLALNISPLKRGEDAPHFAEYIRQMILKQYGEKALYQDGLTVYTTLDLPTQRRAEESVYQGLRAYDRRHGWRGPLAKLKTLDDWQEQIEKIAENYSHSWRIGEAVVVLKVGTDNVRIGLSDGTTGMIAAKDAKWTGKGALSGYLKAGDVVMAKPLNSKGGDGYSLEQLPAVQGALVAIDVKTGEVLAMVGGLGEGVGFNRAIMARRQVGSSFKPLVYAAAMEKGYTPASTVLDAPIVFRFGDKEWKPHNYDKKFTGLTTLRTGLEQSRNLMTVRLAQDVGMRQVAELGKRMGLKGIPTTDLSVALGSVDESLMEMTNAYAVFPRGGTYVEPTYLRRVQDSAGVTLFRAHTPCENCSAQLGASPEQPPEPPKVPSREAMSPQAAYLMTNVMQGVVLRGTGYSLSSLGRPIGGKTGTTNDYVDAWFVGFTPSVSIGVWVGFDTPKSLGHGETGGRTALPIWKQFAENQFKATPIEGFSVPAGIEFVRVDAKSGLLPGAATDKTITEAFVEGTAPTQVTTGYDDSGMEIWSGGDTERPVDAGSGGGSSSGGGQGQPGGGSANPIENLLRTFGIY
ncbi:MAG: PBP1A family penicillin-binding protein [Alphaproteobacteria bacterium]|nr:MAG: PBP1A family penicillin-binding protein [Alphaproteobacteria bacterium]